MPHTFVWFSGSLSCLATATPAAGSLKGQGTRIPFSICRDASLLPGMTEVGTGRDRRFARIAVLGSSLSQKPAQSGSCHHSGNAHCQRIGVPWQRGGSRVHRSGLPHVRLCRGRWDKMPGRHGQAMRLRPMQPRELSLSIFSGRPSRRWPQSPRR